jgi:hypothetical protein
LKARKHNLTFLSIQACDKFTLLADHSDKVPDLKGKKYHNFQLTDEDWKVLQLMKEVLEVCYLFILAPPSSF